MRRSHTNPLPDAEFDVTDEQSPTSKTRRKAEMQSLQDLGERLVLLPADRLKRTPLPESLRDAVMEARRLITKHEAKRRQMQYVGRLMRDVDPAPIEAALASFEGVSASDKARLHRLERDRDALIDDESVITEVGNRYPAADLQRLRQLRRNVLRERAENRPPKSYREIYQMLKDLDAGGAAPIFSKVIPEPEDLAPDDDQDKAGA